jgi:hypothetical protein
MKSGYERQQERRDKKLADVQAQISNGSLTVRRMTADERARYPVRPATASRQDRKPGRGGA